MTIDVGEQELVAFLVEAKRRTYAAQGDEASVAPLLPGSRQLEYGEGRWFYRDIYFGSDRFVGQETVYADGNPVWAMCYAGGVVGSAVDAAQAYAFLRRALRAVTPAYPYRGPRTFGEGPYLYTNESRGGVERFWGVEVIARGGQPVYELRYSGGLLRA